MKTIYLKAEVLEEANNNILIDINGNKIWCGSESIEQAQVLAVEQLPEWLEKKGYDNIWIGKDEVCLFDYDGGAVKGAEKFDGSYKGCAESISQLTELVRSKERTLEDVVRTMLKQASHILTDEVKQEAEQLLKNRE